MTRGTESDSGRSHGPTSGRAATSSVTAARHHATGPTGAGDDAPANLVVLSGRLSSDPVIRELASGSVLCTLEVTTPSATGAAASVPVAWFDPPGEVSFVGGDAVVVVGEVRRRFFRGAVGTQSRTEVVAGAVVRASQRSRVRQMLARVGLDVGR